MWPTCPKDTLSNLGDHQHRTNNTCVYLPLGYRKQVRITLVFLESSSTLTMHALAYLPRSPQLGKRTKRYSSTEQTSTSNRLTETERHNIIPLLKDLDDEPEQSAQLDDVPNNVTVISSFKGTPWRPAKGNKPIGYHLMFKTVLPVYISATSAILCLLDKYFVLLNLVLGENLAFCFIIDIWFQYESCSSAYAKEKSFKYL
ncbi:MAG: hypothetical protein EXX96DRAFT_609253 [Benjaminiella poitrasii]|nr:MAG: hypothetical protein EXX96DRAFT_609253 [Benjaminiella poitrasii]